MHGERNPCSFATEIAANSDTEFLASETPPGSAVGSFDRRFLPGSYQENYPACSPTLIERAVSPGPYSRNEEVEWITF